MNKDNNGNPIQTAAIAALAASTKTPFKTAFKVTIGIALAQLPVMLAVPGVLGLGVVGLVAMVRK